MSLHNSYYLSTGLTGTNAKKINPEDERELGYMLNSDRLERMNFKANENLDTGVTRKIRDQSF